MKHISQLENFVHPPLEGKEVKNILLSAVYNDASAKLRIYQRSQMINATRFMPKKPVTKCHQSSRRSSTKVTSQAIYGEENVPNERILNEIKLDQELTLLRKIYAIALSELDYSSESTTDATETQTETETDAPKASRPHAQLYAAIEAQRPDKNEVEQALSTLEANKATLKALKSQLAEEHKAAEDKLAEQDECIATLRHNLRNVRLLNDLELRLVQRWEENRYTQASIVGANEERTLQQQIDGLRQRMADEERIIAAVDRFSVKQFAELNASIVAWQTKYARVWEIKCDEIQAKERQIQQLQKSFERHRETYAARKQFVHDYLSEKEVERQLYEQQIYRVQCAVRIQAWWRGLMVRRGLGPFKKKSKKGKKGKGKAK
ncbi:dynein regulatory complex protein 9 [Rhagoletis pomonella]|uniref:dynein regulatory complex protein 9 n=1 Tax=Rhagoletis pomonella TaxID=28610 RepID=UPI0017806308|nr:dynein regulatory complex protein 9 [Rhagoletis pomonella]